MTNVRQKHLSNWLLECRECNNPKVQQQQKKINSGGLSQETLPLQIVQSSRDSSKTKLKRFNSHDTSANMFSVTEFENARLARRNDLELDRQKQRFEINSMSSSCDSTGESKGSKLSNVSKDNPIKAGTFLDRYSLPRIVRLYSNKPFVNEFREKQQNSNSSRRENLTLNESTLSSQQEQLNSFNNNTDIDGSDKNERSTCNNTQLLLLFRRLKKYKIYHAIDAKHSTNKKKGIRISQDFTGYFSLVNEKQTPTAIQYTTMTQLVRERVYKFLSIDKMQGYTESRANDKTPGKIQYIKITAKAGKVFRLLAVFEDGAQDSKNSTTPDKTKLNSIGRDTKKGRYAQLIGEDRQKIFVPLLTKGRFFEVYANRVPQLSSKCPLEFNNDCVFRISSINDETSFPITLRLIAKHNEGTTSNSNIPETIKITKLSFEDSVIACPIDESDPNHLVKLHLNPQMKFVKFENEKMFSNQNIQNLLKFCQFNFDCFVQTIDHVELPKEKLGNKFGKVKTKALSKFFSNKKSSPAHERDQDSIIFLSKTDLENIELKKQLTQETHKILPGNGYVKPFITKTCSFINLNNVDQYADMSKMTRKLSISDNKDLNDSNVIQKCYSLQNIELNDSINFQSSDFNQSQMTKHANETDDDKIEKDQLRQKSFITEKLLHEFHVKTKQYSKSSSSLHQLMKFSVPEKMNIREIVPEKKSILTNE